ncbi:hypothetical protein AMECASPLE_022706, partial [Ameca splendens]
MKPLHCALHSVVHTIPFFISSFYLLSNYFTLAPSYITSHMSGRLTSYSAAPTMSLYYYIYGAWLKSLLICCSIHLELLEFAVMKDQSGSRISADALWMDAFNKQTVMVFFTDLTHSQNDTQE